jgi:hypothetical protein
MLNNEQRPSLGLESLYEAPGPGTAPAALGVPLRFITAYQGWLTLEYSETVPGKPKPRVAVQQLPDGPIPAGNSFKEAKRAIEGHPKSRIKRSR